MAVRKGACDLGGCREKQGGLLVNEDGAPPLRGRGGARVRRAQGRGGEDGIGGIRGGRKDGRSGAITSRRGGRVLRVGIQLVAALGARGGRHVREPRGFLFVLGKNKLSTDQFSHPMLWWMAGVERGG